jgi:hypothetical protein
LAAHGAFGFGADGIALTMAGAELVGQLGLDTTTLARSRRPLCRTCLDSSERRHHLAGAFGSALRGWLDRVSQPLAHPCPPSSFS